MNYLDEIEILARKYLGESIDYSHSKLGVTKFTKTDGSETYIQQIMNDYATAKNITFAKVQAIVDTKVASMKSNMEQSTKLNGTMLSNLHESVVFELLDGIPTAENEIKFEKRVFQELFQEIKSEVPEFYPLSNAFETKRIEPTIWYSPDKLAPEFDSVDTAACTADAKLIFNVSFMSKLIRFAHIKGIKAAPNKLHGKKYVSQGGRIPDEYLYCEFVLLHEIMHYGNGDFFFEKAYGLRGRLVNYVGDFVTNYNLVKSGYAQLPIGLFNDEINYDRYNSYQEMYDVVEAEMNKLSPEDQNNMQDQMDKMGDNMPKDGEGADPKDGAQQKPKEGKPQDGESQDGKPQEGESQDGKPQDGKPQDGKPQDGESQDGKPQEGESQDGKPQDGESKDGKSGKGKQSAEEKAEQQKAEAAAKSDLKNQEERAKEKKEAEAEGKSSGLNTNDGKQKKNVPSSVDDIMKDNAAKLDAAQKDTEKQTKTGMSKDAMTPGALSDMMSGLDTGTGKNSADGNPYHLGEKQYKPKLNWKQMLKKMVPSGFVSTDTYSKPSRRTTSSMVSISQTGSGVVKPGTKKEDSDQKGLCFVLDNSGSTMGAIGAMQNDIMNLIQKEAKKLNNDLYVMKFSNDVHYFKVDVKKKKYARITDVEEFINLGKSSVKCDTPMASLFKTSYGGGTELTSKVTIAIKSLLQHANFNVILFSDTDIVSGENAKQLKAIYALGKKQFALIGCDINDYKAFVDLLGDKNNISHF